MENINIKKTLKNENKKLIYMIIGVFASFIFMVLAIVAAVNINTFFKEEVKKLNDLRKALGFTPITNFVLPTKLIVVKNIGITLAVFNAILFTFFIYKLIKQKPKNSRT